MRYLKCATLGVLVSVLLAAVPVADAKPVIVKKTWTVGEAEIAGKVYELTYTDAHLKISTRGNLLEDPFEFPLGGFDMSSAKQTIGDPEQSITVDWTMGPGKARKGKSTPGATFGYDDLGMPRIIDIKVLESYLTGVTIPDIGFNANRLDIPAPGGFRDERKAPGEKRRAAAADAVPGWTFRNDYPALSPTISYSGVEFYLSPVEPGLDQLNDAGLVALGAALLFAVPDFALAGGGLHFIGLEDVGAREWLIVRYTASWTDEFMSAVAGAPALLSVPTFVAVAAVPEPGTGGLLLLGLAVLAWARTTRHMYLPASTRRR